MQPRRFVQPEVTPDERQPPPIARQHVPREAAGGAGDDARVAGAKAVEPPDGGGAPPADEGLTARTVGEREQRAIARVEAKPKAIVLKPERVRRGDGEQATEQDVHR